MPGSENKANSEYVGTKDSIVFSLYTSDEGLKGNKNRGEEGLRLQKAQEDNTGAMNAESGVLSGFISRVETYVDLMICRGVVGMNCI